MTPAIYIGPKHIASHGEINFGQTGLTSPMQYNTGNNLIRFYPDGGFANGTEDNFVAVLMDCIFYPIK
jgi:hypothetical protein